MIAGSCESFIPHLHRLAAIDFLFLIESFTDGKKCPEQESVGGQTSRQILKV